MEEFDFDKYLLEMFADAHKYLIKYMDDTFKIMENTNMNEQEKLNALNQAKVLCKEKHLEHFYKHFSI